jgi:exosortase
LLFAVPLPYRLETALSYPLQTIATKVSCWLLQSLAQPAIAEGHTVLVHDVRLEVVQACSGLRMFVGVIALACAFLILFARPWWYRVAVLTSALPIAIFVNSLRIVSAALFYQWFTGPTARQWIHDITGWVMIPWAACLFYLLTVYLDNLFVEVRPYEVRAPKKRFRTKPSDQNQSSDSPLGAVTDA